AINPFTQEQVPVWVANFVLADYGTGAIMAVPGHDERDFEFATKYGLPIRRVVQPVDDAVDGTLPFTGDGIAVDSGEFTDMTSDDAWAAMANAATERGFGEITMQYRLKDWGISRQRYWGTPIPVIHCPTDGIVPVPDNQLPVELPKIA